MQPFACKLSSELLQCSLHIPLPPRQQHQLLTPTAPPTPALAPAPAAAGMPLLETFRPQVHQLTVGSSCYAGPSSSLASKPCPPPLSCPPFLNLHPSRASQMPHSGLGAVSTAGTKWAHTFLSKCDEEMTHDAATATVYRLQSWI